MTENLNYIPGRPLIDISEIKFRKRKRVRHIEDGGSSRSHKDDEKARRHQIAHQFAKLRQLIPNGASLRARQEVLQKVRSTIWVCAMAYNFWCSLGNRQYDVNDKIDKL